MFEQSVLRLSNGGYFTILFLGHQTSTISRQVSPRISGERSKITTITDYNECTTYLGFSHEIRIYKNFEKGAEPFDWA